MPPNFFHLLQCTKGFSMSFGGWSWVWTYGPVCTRQALSAISLALLDFVFWYMSLAYLLILVLNLFCSPSNIWIYALAAFATQVVVTVPPGLAHVFLWLGSLFLFSVNHSPLPGWVFRTFSIHLLKDIMAASLFGTLSKAARATIWLCGWVFNSVEHVAELYDLAWFH